MTDEMVLDTKSISKVLDDAKKKIKEILMETYPNLYFYISPLGDVSCWVRTPDGRDGTAVKIPFVCCVNLGFTTTQQLYFSALNAQVGLVHTLPDKYFYCTECGEVKPRNELADCVMAACYCKECAKKPEIKKLIEASHERGFYD